MSFAPRHQRGIIVSGLRQKQLDFIDAVRSGDAESVSRIWEATPALDKRPPFNINMCLDDAINGDHVKVVSILVECCGADINWRLGVTDRGRLATAVECSAVNCIDWILKNGGNLNVETPDGNRCFALEKAVHKGDLEMVKLMIKHGGEAVYKWKNNSGILGNPLTIAINSGQDEIADYFRSIGIPEPKRQEAPPSDPLRTHLMDFFGDVDEDEIHQVVQSDPPISIVIGNDSENTILVTRGMSSAPVFQNDGSPLYAELMMQVPHEWQFGPDSSDPRARWAIGCLQQIAVFPHASGEPFSFYVMCPNGTPPAPILDGSDLTGVMAIQASEEFGTYTDDEKTVTLYHVIPLYTEEFELVEKFGIQELLTRFGSHEISEVVIFDRPNVAVD